MVEYQSTPPLSVVATPLRGGETLTTRAPCVTYVGVVTGMECAGVRAFGIAGLLVGPLLLCYGIELARIYRADDAHLPP